MINPGPYVISQSRQWSVQDSLVGWDQVTRMEGLLTVTDPIPWMRPNRARSVDNHVDHDRPRNEVELNGNFDFIIE